MPIQELSFTIFKKILNFVLNFVSQGSLSIPEYRHLFIGRVLQLYTMEPAAENIGFSNF